MHGKAGRVPTGNVTLDDALGGGFPHGSTILVEGEDGAGSTEFAMTVLRTATHARAPPPARFVSALRSPARVRRELDDLFSGGADAEGVDVRHLPVGRGTTAELLAAVDEAEGGVLAVESTSALARAEPKGGLAALVHDLGDRAAARDALLLLLHAPGSLPHEVEVALAESVDGVLSFRWLDSGPSRRRLLRIRKLRGLAPVLDGELVPVYDVSLHRGTGFHISKVKSLI